MTDHLIFIFVPYWCQLEGEQYHMPSLLHGNTSCILNWIMHTAL